MREFLKTYLNIPLSFGIGCIFVLGSGIFIGIYSRILEQRYSYCPDCYLTTFETMIFQIMAIIGFSGFALMIGSIGWEIRKKYRK